MPTPLTRALFQHTAQRCYYCGRTIPEHTQCLGRFRHDLKWSRALNNVVPSCWLCARLKGRRDLEEFRAFISQIPQSELVRKGLERCRDEQGRFWGEIHHPVPIIAKFRGMHLEPDFDPRVIEAEYDQILSDIDLTKLDLV